MAYETRCTCNEMQLALVGCDCDHTGPVKIVLSLDDEIALAEAAHDAFIAAEEAAEAAYWEKRRAEIDGAELWLYDISDPREDFAEWALEAAKHQ